MKAAQNSDPEKSKLFSQNLPDERLDSRLRGNDIVLARGDAGQYLQSLERLNGFASLHQSRWVRRESLMLCGQMQSMAQHREVARPGRNRSVRRAYLQILQEVQIVPVRVFESHQACPPVLVRWFTQERDAFGFQFRVDLIHVLN